MIDSIRQALNRLRAFFRKEPLDRDVEAEMAAHLELAIEENLRRGLPAPEARRQAFIKFGGVERRRLQRREYHLAASAALPRPAATGVVRRQ